MVTNYAFFFTSPHSDPQRDRAMIETGGVRTTIYAVPSVAVVPDLAKQAVQSGAQLIELCGDFDAKTTAEIIEAVGTEVPVGVVRYGPEAINALARLAD